MGSEKSKIVLSIKELIEGCDIKEKSFPFFVDSYQRGYKWGEKEVNDLLDDIDKFKPTDDSEFYCLQPLVIKKVNDKYELIDGQQRCTTLFLILNFLEMETFKIEYRVRASSQEFLENKHFEKPWEESKKEFDNIDNFHFSKAYEFITKWFSGKESTFIEDFKDKLINKVKVIWYETIDADSIDIFTRINLGKIPLTNAELIKALFLNSSNFKNHDYDKLRLQQLEIASEWDRIEYALQDDSFWFFINKENNNLATRIEFIFNLIADNKANAEQYSTFIYFNEKFKSKNEEEINSNWQEVKKQYQTLEEWFNDRILYHKIGYLITIGEDIKILLENYKKSSKSEFNNWLNDKIKKKIDKINISDLEYGNPDVRDVLLLNNIQTVLKNEKETNRFPFDRFKKDNWDVEHIHAIATQVNVIKENQIEWLNNNFIDTSDHNDGEKNNQIREIINSQKTISENEFSTIVEYVLGGEDNSLRNLCLLDRKTNRSYKNDGFKEKRKKIIAREMEGTFIPICTKNVFMKYYSTEIKDIEIWNEHDRESYINKIEESLKLS